MNRACLLPLLLVMACAHVGGGAEATPGTDRAAAQRLYTVAEARYDAGAYDEAVSLMRHSLLQLPPEPEHDALRHKLVLRMAHTQLMWFSVTGHPAPLHDALQLLTRYLERHEQLFGETKAALAERGEVYELLYQVETRLDPPEGDATAEGDESETLVAAAAVSAAPAEAVPPALEATAEVATVVPASDNEAATTTATATAPTPETAPTPAPTPAPAPAPTPATETSTPRRAAPRFDERGDEIRDVLVRKQRRLASLDDPRVKAQARGSFSTPEAGLVLTAPGVERVHGPRPLVRGWSRLAGDGDLGERLLARRAGQSLLQGAREPLRSCYAAAFARRPVAALDSAVEASIHPDGSISHVRIVGGGLVDGYGDMCVIEALQRASVPPLSEVEEPVRVRVALRFFYESAVYINEGTGEQIHEGGTFLTPNEPRPHGLPPIDMFVKPPR